IPRVYHVDSEHHPESPTWDKSVQVSVGPTMRSQHAQTSSPAKSIGVQASRLYTHAKTQTEVNCACNCKSNNIKRGDGGDEIGQLEPGTDLEDEEEDLDLPSEDQDQDYDPSEDHEKSSSETDTTWHGNRVFLVAEAKFRQLFKICPECYASCSVTIEPVGTVVEVFSECPAGHHSYWVNQEIVNQQPLLNLLLCAGILFAGQNPTPSLRMLSSIGVQVVSCSTFFTLQRTHLWPANGGVWNQEQASLLEEARANPLRLAGDGRADSPGFSAKFGTYSVLDLETTKIVHFELVQVGGSGRMELEGLKRSLSFLEAKGLTVELLITDRHVQGKAFMKKEKPEIRHEFDVWHVSKGIKKELVAAMRSPTCAELALWSRPVQNHLCWAAASSQGNPDLIVPKWLSVLNHVRDIHNHTDARFSSCAHGELEPRDWLLDAVFSLTIALIPYSVAFEKLQAIVTKRYLLADLPKLSTRYQTYTVEAFHGLLNHFCPKLCQYSYKGRTARTQLAVLHFNENGNRPQALTEEGDKCYDVKHPKANGGEPVAVKRKEGRTYDYVRRLLDVVRDGAQMKTRGLVLITPSEDPPPLCSSAKKVPKAELIERHKTRFNK
ncbi:unnamed protein product, partial [Ixodes pacificus]